MKQALKSIYCRLPFKQPVFEIVRAVVRPGERVYKHLHFEGDFRVAVDDTHAFRIRHYGYEVENSLFWAGLYRGWEKTSLRLWSELARAAQVVFDVGANTGVYSLIAKALNPQARVYAFEPVRRVCEKLRTNVELNGYDVRCLECAASNFDGTATVFDTPTDHVYSVTVNKNLHAPETAVIPTEIETMRLDNFIERERISRLDLVKLDVETHEPEVLEGLGEYLLKFRPVMLVEVLSDEVGARVERLISEIDYLYFNLDEASGTLRRVDRITKSDYFNYLICREETARDLKILD